MPSVKLSKKCINSPEKQTITAVGRENLLSNENNGGI